jgi:hypothetical protein
MPVYRPEAEATPPAPSAPAAPVESTQPNMPAFPAAPAAPTPTDPNQTAWQPQPPPAPAPTGELPALPAQTLPTPGAHDIPAAGGSNVDWDQVIGELQAVTEEDLGNRSRKVKDLLGSAEHSQAGIESAIDQIPTISILFVDSSRLESLAQKLRARLQSYVG